MLPVTILLTESGNSWEMPDPLKSKYEDLKNFEKKKANALRSFRPPPVMPDHLKALEHSILSKLPAGSPKNLKIDALNNVIYKPGLNGKQTTYLKIVV